MVNSGLDLALLGSVDLVAQLAQSLLGLVGNLVSGVVGIHLVLPGLVLGGVLLGLVNSLVDVFLAQVGGSGDGNLLLLAGAQVLGGDLHNAVGIDIKGNLDLRHATGCGSNAGELEAAQGLVVSSHFPLALEHMDLNGGLAVSSGGEDLALVGRNGGVPIDQTGEHAAHGLNAQGQGGDIQQQDILHIAGEHAALNGSANGYALIGVDALEAFLAGDLLHGFLNGGDTGRTANQQDLVQIGSAEARIGHSLTDGLHGALYQVGSQLIELCTAQGHIQVLGAGRVGGDIGQVDVGGGHAGQLNLGLLGSFLQTLHSNLIAGQINAFGLLELGNQVIHDSLVEVIAAQVGVTGSSQNLDDAVADVQDGHIEGAAAQVVDHDLLLGFLIQAIGQSSCGGLVDDTLHVQAGDLAGILGGLTLGIAKVSRNRDDSLGDGLAQIAFRVSLQLLQDHSADLLGGVVLAVQIHMVILAHVTLDGRDGAVSIGDRLALCNLTNHTLAGLGECYHGRGSTVALCIGDDNRLAAFQNSNTGIGSTKVNTDNLRHNVFLLYSNEKVYTNLICNLNHCEADDFVAHLEALLEDLGDHILAKAFVLRMHHRIVEVGIEAVAWGPEDLHAQACENLHKLIHGELHALLVGDILGGLVQSPLQIVIYGKQLHDGICLAVAVGGFFLLDGTLAEIVVFRSQPQQTVVLCIVLFFKGIGFRCFRRLGFLLRCFCGFLGDQFLCGLGLLLFFLLGHFYTSLDSEASSFG